MSFGNDAAMEFVEKAIGKTPKVAFLRTEISSKKADFINIDIPEHSDPYSFAADLIAKTDLRVSEVDGPAGCVDITSTTYGLLEEREDDERVYIFFGWTRY